MKGIKIGLIVILSFVYSCQSNWLSDVNSQIQASVTNDITCCANDTSRTVFWANYALNWDGNVDSLRLELFVEWLPKSHSNDTVFIFESIRIEDSSTRYDILINDTIFLSNYGMFPKFVYSRESKEHFIELFKAYVNEGYPRFKNDCCGFTILSQSIHTAIAICPGQKYAKSWSFL